MVSPFYERMKIGLSGFAEFAIPSVVDRDDPEFESVF